jgi:hypothetical protein
MGVSTLLHLLVLSVAVGGTGWLLYRVWLHRLGLSWRVGIGLALAVLSVLFSNLASIFGYSLWLMLGVWMAFAAGLVIWWLITRQKHDARPDIAVDWVDVLFHLFIFGFFLAPAFVLYLPFDTDAQGFGYLALMVREGGTIDTLAPWQPDVRYLYSPALFVWWAFFSDLFSLPLHQVMLPFTHVLAGLTAWLCIDLGQMLLPDRPRARWLMPLMLIAGLGFFLTLMDAAYTSVMGFLFVVLFLILVFRVVEKPEPAPGLLASIPLAAAALTHPDTIIILLLGYVPFYATFWLSQERDRHLGVWLFLIIPAAGIALTVPWTLKVLPLFFEENVVSPFFLSLSHFKQLTLYHGYLVPLLAVGGTVLAVRRRRLADVFMVTWLVLTIDFSMFGLVDQVVSLTGLDIMRYVYPYSVAWHGPILIYPYLATLVVDQVLTWKPIWFNPKLGMRLAGAGMGIMMLLVTFQQPVLEASRPLLPIFGAFSSRDDLAAMAYLRDNAPEDALILNYPINFEAHWVPVIAERECVTFREQPFFSGAEPYYARRDALTDVYFDLGGEAARELLLEYGVTHVIIPQIVNRPDRFADMREMIRWQWPEAMWYSFQSLPAESDWLELVFEQDGAQVYRVLSEE